MQTEREDREPTDQELIASLREEGYDLLARCNELSRRNAELAAKNTRMQRALISILNAAQLGVYE